jgi:two-component sensor histidine kinase
MEEILVTGRDITEQREAEMLLQNNLQHLEIVTQDLQSSLKEKKSLLREIHHRVKNNLQIISAITLMHEKSARFEREKNFFKDFQQRIKAMSKIHETLYRSDDLEKMNISEYIPDLVKNLTLTYNVDLKRINCVFEIEQIMMPLNTAMHLGLIVNELVSNAFKYAFPRKRNGEILIKIQTTDKKMILLQIKDNGVGFPPEIDFTKSNSMGLRIVRTSTKQLKGEILLEKGDGGTDWIILFKEKRLLQG